MAISLALWQYPSGLTVVLGYGKLWKIWYGESRLCSGSAGVLCMHTVQNLQLVDV